MYPLLTPWLLLSMLCAIIVFLIFKAWIACLIVIIVAIVFNWRTKCIAFKSLFRSKEKGTYNLKVMSFNINCNFSNVEIKAKEITGFIISNDPDVVFISELGDFNRDAIDLYMKEQYPYSAFEGVIPHGFYSKYAIHNWESIVTYSKEKGACLCQLETGGVTITLCGCHFASNNFMSDNQYMTPSGIKSFKTLWEYIKNIQYVYALRVTESNTVRGLLKKKNTPTILMGDFNDVSGSVVLRNVEGVGLKDSWWERGLGYGATIKKPFPYRIDHMLYSNDLRLMEINILDSKELSDHMALCAEFAC